MRLGILPLLLAVSLSCTDDGATEPRNTTVVVRNGSSVAMTGVLVTPGPGTQVIAAAHLGPGDATDAVPVAAVHDYPIVRATVGGREYTLHPVEGFTPGWNPRRPDGRYVVVLTYDDDNRLAMSVQSAEAR